MTLSIPSEESHYFVSLLGLFGETAFQSFFEGETLNVHFHFSIDSKLTRAGTAARIRVRLFVDGLKKTSIFSDDCYATGQVPALFKPLINFIFKTVDTGLPNNFV